MSISVSNVFKLRDKLCQALPEYCGVDLDPKTYADFVRAVVAALPPGVSEAAVWSSLKYLLTRQLDYVGLHEAMWRLGGNVALLKQGKAALPWTGQGEIEPMPVQVLSAVRAKTYVGKPGMCYRLRVLAGSACPTMLYKTWGTDFVRYLAGNALGFTPRWGKYPYHDPSELVRLRFQAHIDPQFCRDGVPGFDQISCSSACLSWNRGLMRARNHNLTPCPNNFVHPCHRCPVGYDQCPAGTHPKTFEAKVCAGCNQEALHDTDHSSGLCVGCATNIPVS